MKQIVAVIGDYYHSADLIRQSLELALRNPDGSMLADLVIAEAEELPARLKERPAAVILFKENRVIENGAVRELWMTDDLEESIVRFVGNGGGWLSWHSGMASYAEDGPLNSMLRGYFAYHPEKLKTVSYRPEAAGRLGELVKDNGPFEFEDEHYFVVCDQSQTNVFLYSESADGQSIAGWSHEFGEGRVCCLTPAHTLEGLLHPQVVALVRSAVTWCSRME